MEERGLVGDLAQVGRQGRGHAMQLELRAPDVGGDFYEAVLLCGGRWDESGMLGRRKGKEESEMSVKDCGSVKKNKEE